MDNCNITLSGVALDCGNVGGLKKLYLSPIADVTEVTVDEQGQISGITMVESKKFVEYSFRRSNASFTMTMNRDDQAGTSYCETVVSVQLNRMDADKRKEVNALLKGNFYVIAIDNNDVAWFVGYESYLAGGGTGQSGAEMAEGNFFAIEMTGQTAELPNVVLSTALKTVI